MRLIIDVGTKEVIINNETNLMELLSILKKLYTEEELEDVKLVLEKQIVTNNNGEKEEPAWWGGVGTTIGTGLPNTITFPTTNPWIITSPSNPYVYTTGFSTTSADLEYSKKELACEEEITSTSSATMVVDFADPDLPF